MKVLMSWNVVGKGLETQNQEKSSGMGGEEEEVIEARDF